MKGSITGLAEIVLWSHDLERSFDFYCGIFGLERMEQPEDVKPRFLRVASGTNGVPHMLVLVPHPDPSGTFPAAKPERPLHHLAFTAAASEYDSLRARCEAAGHGTRDGVHPVLQGVRTFYVDDPDGNEVEVIARKP